MSLTLNGHLGLETQSTGLIISHNTPWIAAIPPDDSVVQPIL